jgi:NADH-quinone oxidoreductase subunit H
MLRYLAAACLSAFVCLSLAAADEKDAKKEMAKLQGEWSMISGEHDGIKLPEENVKTAKRVCKGDESTVKFGDVLFIGDREINLQVAPLDIGILYVLAMVSLGVYGVVLGGWASNNRWSLLGGIRGSAQMISYELAMGLALVAMIMTYGTLDLQVMARAQGGTILGFIPAWGILYQPLAFLIFLTAGIAESKRVPFDLPESESELVSGFFTEYSGTKHLMFFMTDFVEVIIVSGLAATLFFGGWQVPFLARDGFHFPGGATLLLPNLIVAILQIVSFSVKVLFFCWLQIMIRWTLPRFRYDQLMQLGWIGMLPLGFLNAIMTAVAILSWGKH